MVAGIGKFLKQFFKEISSRGSCWPQRIRSGIDDVSLPTGAVPTLPTALSFDKSPTIKRWHASSSTTPLVVAIAALSTRYTRAKSSAFYPSHVCDNVRSPMLLECVESSKHVRGQRVSLSKGFDLIDCETESARSAEHRTLVKTPGKTVKNSFIPSIFFEFINF